MARRKTRRKSRKRRKGGRGPCPKPVCPCGTFERKCKAARKTGRAYWFNYKNGGMDAVNSDPVLKAKRAAFVQEGRDVVAKQTQKKKDVSTALDTLSRQKGIVGDAAFLQKTIQSKLGGKKRRKTRRKKRRTGKRRRRTRKR